jgi:hypothetical protein
MGFVVGRDPLGQVFYKLYAASTELNTVNTSHSLDEL